MHGMNTPSMNFSPPQVNKNMRLSMKRHSVSQSLIEEPIIDIKTELLSQIKQLTSENETYKKEMSLLSSLKTENSNYKSTIQSQEKQIAMLEEKLTLYDTAQSKNEAELTQEIKEELETKYKEQFLLLNNKLSKMQKDLNEKTAMITSLNTTILANKSTIDSLTKSNSLLEEQILHRNEIDNNEITSLKEKINVLELDILDKEKQINDLNEQRAHPFTNINYSSLLSPSVSESNSTNVGEYKKKISKLKHELNEYKKKNEDLQMLCQLKDITIQKNESEIQNVNDTNMKLNIQTTTYEHKIQTLSLHINELQQQLMNQPYTNKDEIQKLKNEIARVHKEHESKIEEMKTKLNENEIEMFKAQNLEKVYKEQLDDKNKEIERKINFINEIQSCLNNKIDENLRLEKENKKLQNKLNDVSKKYNELQINTSKLQSDVKSKESGLHNVIKDLNDNIKKKRMIIQNKKNENVCLADLVNIKKSQIQCIEALQVIQSDVIKENLEKLKCKEMENIEKIKELINGSFYTDDSVDDEEEEESENSEHEDSLINFEDSIDNKRNSVDMNVFDNNQNDFNFE